MGIDEDELAEMREHVNIVLHIAATVRFNEPLKCVARDEASLPCPRGLATVWRARCRPAHRATRIVSQPVAGSQST